MLGLKLNHVSKRGHMTAKNQMVSEPEKIIYRELEN